MGRERLSKFQKWILAKIYEEGFMCAGGWMSHIKRYSGGQTSNVRRAVTSRSLKNMFRKGLIQKYKNRFDLQIYWIFLTKKGFNAFLKVNEWQQKLPNVSFKEYEKRTRKKIMRHEGISNAGTSG